MVNFKIGDRVTVNEECVTIGYRRIPPNEDLVGTVVFVEQGNYREDGLVGVAFDEDIAGHNCDGMCPEGHGWFVRERHLAPAAEKPPSIAENEWKEALCCEI